MLAFTTLALATLPLLDDTCATAPWGGSLSSGSTTFQSGTLGAGDTSDHLRLVLGPGLRAEVSVLFQHVDGDLQLRLWNSDCTTVLATSTSDTDDESVQWDNPGGISLEIVAEVYSDASLGTTVPFQWRSTAAQTSCGFNDAFEPNQSCVGAPMLPAGMPVVTGLSLTSANEDWYSLEVLPTSSESLSVVSGTNAGDTNAQLWTADCLTLLEEVTDPGTDTFQLANTTDSTQTYVLRVFRSDDSTTCSNYGIQRFGSIGVPECTSAPNSSGFAAGLYAIGSTSVGTGGLVLEAFGAPMDQFGIYIYGPQANATPLGNGVLCIDSAGLVRGRAQQGLYTSITFFVDYTDPAAGAGPILPGTTLRFQSWFRDPGDPTGFGLTSALRVTFTP